MTTFLLLSFVLVALAGAFVVPPLWRSPVTADVAQPPQRGRAIGVMAVLVLLTAVLYAAVGAPQAIGDPRAVAGASPLPQQGAQEDAKVDASGAGAPPAQPAMTQAQIEGMVSRLAQRLQTQPADPDGWRMLARSYETLGRFDEAVQAYQRLLGLQPADADLLTDYAVTLGMSQGQTLVGAPEQVIQQALKLNPEHIQALALAGSAAFEKRDYGQAITQWRKLLALIPAQADMRASIERNIAQAESLAAKEGKTGG